MATAGPLEEELGTEEGFGDGDQGGQEGGGKIL